MRTEYPPKSSSGVLGGRKNLKVHRRASSDNCNFLDEVITRNDSACIFATYKTILERHGFVMGLG